MQEGGYISVVLFAKKNIRGEAIQRVGTFEFFRFFFAFARTEDSRISRFGWMVQDRSSVLGMNKIQQGVSSVNKM